jgi:hypothetical protein
MSDKNAAVETAKERTQSEISVLSTGVRAILHPVSASLMQDVVSRIPEPEIPIKYNEAKGRDEPNEFSPIYLKAVSDTERKRASASIDAMAMFGIELVDGLPESTKWLQNLKLMEKLGNLDLSIFDLEDEIDLEFLFKRYIALGNDDLIKIGMLTGIKREDIEQAKASF